MSSDASRYFWRRWVVAHRNLLLEVGDLVLPVDHALAVGVALGRLGGVGLQRENLRGLAAHRIHAHRVQQYSYTD